MNLRIDNATIVAPGSAWHGKSPSVTLSNGHITSLGSVQEPADVVWDASGLRLSAGWCDLRAQFGDPGLEHKEDLESGCAAAAAGGFTEVCLLPNTTPVIQTKNDIQYLIAGNARRVTQVRPLAAVTKGAKGEDFTDMLDLHAAGAAAFSDGVAPIWHTDILLKTLLYLQKIDALLINRPEDRMLTHFASMHEGITSTRLGTPGMPRLAETLIVQRDLQILRYTGGRLHFANISTPESLALIREAKAEGLQISCDVAAYQLLWLDEVLEENAFDTQFKVNPPLREAPDREALLQGLRDGTIDALVTSHTPQDEESKKLEFDLADFGMTGLEMFLPMMLRLKEDLPEDVWINKITQAPRALLGQSSEVFVKDAIANFTLYDPEAEWKYDGSTCKSKGQNHPWFGTEVKGKVKGVVYGAQTWSEDL
ncbi:MAG: dihydroorotase [Bacteroidota bacterium]